MTRLGRRWRSEATARMAQHEAQMALVEANLREITEKLNGLVGVVENWPRQKAIGIRSRLRLERGSP